MSGTVSLLPQIPGFTLRQPAPAAVVPERQAWQAPALAPDVRAKAADAIYGEFYEKVLPREKFDQQMAAVSDKELADKLYESFYSGKIDRGEFNQKMGMTSAAGATTNAVTSGLMGGFQDELSAGVGAGLRTVGSALTGTVPTPSRIGAAYDQELQAQRENADVFRQNNPYLGRGLEFAGGALLGAGAATRAAPSLMSNVGTAAGIGAVTGFGEGEGAGNRLMNAAAGAGIGAGIGAVAPYAVQGVSMVLGRVGKVLGLGNSEKVAGQMLLKAFADDGIPPAQIGEKIAAWQAAGAKPETLFDLGGENVRRLARTAAGRSGPGTEKAVSFLEGRQADQMNRVLGDVEATLGQSAADFHPTVQALDTTRRVSAAPKYEAAFSRIIPTADEAARVQPFIRDPIGQEALQKGMRVIELEHLARDEPFRPQMYGVIRDDAGKWILEPDKVPNLRLMDAVKRGFDNIVEGFRDTTTGRLVLDQYGNAVNSARAAYTGRLREMYPRYGGALDAWAGPSTTMDAAARGRNVFNMKDAEAVSSALEARAKPGEADAFRLGVAQAVRDQIARAPDGVDAVKRMFGSPSKRALLEAAFPDQRAFLAFEALMKREAKMFQNAQFVSPKTGSQTAPRQADAEGFGDMATGAIGDLALSAALPGRSVAGAFGRIATDLGARTRGISPGVADSLAGRLFTSDPGAINKTVGMLSQAEMDNALARIAASRARGMLSRGLSGGINVAR